MARIHCRVFFVVFGFLLLHTATGQTPTSAAGTVVAPDPSAASPNIKADVTDTVMALLNETGYSGSANDANVQEIVVMLMNGTVPTDGDLMRLGFIPQPALAQDTTPVPYIIPGNQPAVDTNIVFPTGNQAGPSSGLQPGPSIGGFPIGGFPTGGFPTGGFPSSGFPSNPAIGTQPNSQGGPQTGGTGAGSDPFGGALTPPIGGAFPSFPSMMGTSPKPALGDPFGLNTIAGGTAGQLPNLGPTDPNALGPKPFPNGGPVGGLGTPGSTVDLLGSLGTIPGGGLGGFPQSPQTGILDAPQNPQNQRGGGGMMNNPFMMMMMMNPEMMDQMLSGENPMMMYMMMQQMQRRPQRPRPTLPSLPGGMSGMGSMSGLGGLGGAGMPMPLPGSSSLGGGTGGLMDLMNSLGPMGGASLPGAGMTPGGTPPMDLAGLSGLGAAGGPSPTSLGGNPMDLIPAAVPSPGGVPAGPTDMSAFLNMINAGPTGAAPSAVPLTDPFIGTAG